MSRPLYVRDLPEWPVPLMSAYIIDAWHRRTSAEEYDGARWYARARQTAREMSDASGLPFRACAGIIAVLSPSTEWHSNVMAAWRIVDARSRGELTPDVRGLQSYGRNIGKAWRISGLPSMVDAVVSGPKVRAFYAAILGDGQCPTVDRHATRVATDGRHDAVTAATFAHVASAYVMAASTLGLDTHTVQATTWLVCKRELAVGRHQMTLSL